MSGVLALLRMEQLRVAAPAFGLLHPLGAWRESIGAPPPLGSARMGGMDPQIAAHIDHAGRTDPTILVYVDAAELSPAKLYWNDPNESATGAYGSWVGSEGLGAGRDAGLLELERVRVGADKDSSVTLTWVEKDLTLAITAPADHPLIVEAAGFTWP